jgi:hypothetical protein
MDIVMPPAFPSTEFRAFLQAATKFFPTLLSDAALSDPQEKRRNFDWSWQAVRYRYRSCDECQDEFRALLANASEEWRAGCADEELTYRLERCIYLFFMGALSVFDSFAYCLYFLGNAIHPSAFLAVANPRTINRAVVAKAYSGAFPKEKITGLLTALADDTAFRSIDLVRNLVGHRISGRRSIAASGTTHADGTRTEWREERWHLPGAAGKLVFDEQLLQRHLDDITRLLMSLASAAHKFVQNHQPVQSTSP